MARVGYHGKEAVVVRETATGFPLRPVAVVAGGGALTGASLPSLADPTTSELARLSASSIRDAFDPAALRLRHDGLAQYASGQWQLTRRGWLALTTTDPTAA